MSEKKTMRLTANQLAALLVLEGACGMLGVGASQLDGFLGLKDEAQILIGAIEFIGKRKQEMQVKWSQAVVIAQPSDMPRLVAP